MGVNILITIKQIEEEKKIDTFHLFTIVKDWENLFERKKNWNQTTNSIWESDSMCTWCTNCTSLESISIALYVFLLISRSETIGNSTIHKSFNVLNRYYSNVGLPSNACLHKHISVSIPRIISNAFSNNFTAKLNKQKNHASQNRWEIES